MNLYNVIYQVDKSAVEISIRAINETEAKTLSYKLLNNQKMIKFLDIERIGKWKSYITVLDSAKHTATVTASALFC